MYKSKTELELENLEQPDVIDGREEENNDLNSGEWKNENQGELGIEFDDST